MTRTSSVGHPSPPIARIAVDLLGGDNAPAVVVDGVSRACADDADIRLLLVGPPEVADGLIAALDRSARDRVTTLAASAAAGMADPAVRGVRTGTTVRAAATALAAGQVDAIVSAGPSGATVTAAALCLGRIPGVRRPALAAVVPALTGPVLLLDVGASPDSGTAALGQHAALGAAYAAVALDLPAPRVGLLSLGAEDGKGDRIRREAAGRIAAQALPGRARFVGNVEGQDVPLGGPADVVVTDGFTGNVLLKGIEGAVVLAGGDFPHEHSPRAAVLLGAAGAVIVCHGAATGPDIASGIALAARAVRRDETRRVAAAYGAVVDGTEETYR